MLLGRSSRAIALPLEPPYFSDPPSPGDRNRLTGSPTVSEPASSSGASTLLGFLGAVLAPCPRPPAAGTLGCLLIPFPGAYSCVGRRTERPMSLSLTAALVHRYLLTCSSGHGRLAMADTACDGVPFIVSAPDASLHSPLRPVALRPSRSAWR